MFLWYFLHFSGGLSGNGLRKSQPFTLPPFLVSTVHFLLLNSAQPGDGDATEEEDSGRAAAPAEQFPVAVLKSHSGRGLLYGSPKAEGSWRGENVWRATGTRSQRWTPRNRRPRPMRGLAECGGVPRRWRVFSVGSSLCSSAGPKPTPCSEGTTVVHPCVPLPHGLPTNPNGIWENSCGLLLRFESAER
jgi:hypothetical protein